MIKQGKSGQGAKKLTQLQNWKIQRYAFLDAYLKPRKLGEEMGKVTYHSFLPSYFKNVCHETVRTCIYKMKQLPLVVMFQATHELGDSDVEEVEGQDNAGDVAEGDIVPGPSLESKRSSWGRGQRKGPR